MFMKSVLMVFLCVLSTGAFANYCASVYQGEDMTGAVLDLAADQEIVDLGVLIMDPMEYRNWDNKISSVVVNSGCTLETYQYQNLGLDWDTGEVIGRKEVYQNIGPSVLYVEGLYDYDNMISSLKWTCN